MLAFAVVFSAIIFSPRSLIVTSCLTYFRQEDAHMRGHVVNDTAGVFMFKQITGLYPNTDYSELTQPLSATYH